MPTKKQIVPLTFFSRNNILNSNFIKESIQYYYHYFLPIQSYTSILFDERATEEYILVESSQIETTKFLDLFYSSNKKQLLIYLESFQRLYDICKIMQEHRFVHFNLCEETIVFSNERPYIQDFSQSFIHSAITEERKKQLFENYQPKIKHRPPSWHLFCYISQNTGKTLSLNVIDIVLQDYIQSNNLDINDEFFLDFHRKWAVYLQKFMNKSKEEIFNNLLDESLNWDIYSLSFLYLKYFHALKEQNVFTQNLFEILKKNLFFN